MPCDEWLVYFRDIEFYLKGDATDFHWYKAITATSIREASEAA
jgi:hypothetical protein